MTRRSTITIAAGCILTLAACAPGAPEADDDTEQARQDLTAVTCQTIAGPTVTATPVDAVIGRATRLRAMVTRNGLPLAGRSVTFRLDGVVMATVTTNAAGVAKFPLTASGSARTGTVVATVAPTGCESVAGPISASASVYFAAAPQMEAGRIGGPTSFVDVRAATSTEMQQLPGMVRAEITVRRSLFGWGTTSQRGTVPVSFTAGPGAPPPSTACDTRGPWSCAPQARWNDGASGDLNDGLGIYSFSDRRHPPNMAGQATATTTTWERDYQDAWDACALNAAAVGRSAWGHDAYTFIPRRIGRLYLYTYPTQAWQFSCTSTTCTYAWSYRDDGAFRFRYLDVLVTARVTCTE